MKKLYRTTNIAGKVYHDEVKPKEMTEIELLQAIAPVEIPKLREEIEQLQAEVKLHEVMDNIPHGEMGKEYKKLEAEVSELKYKLNSEEENSRLFCKQRDELRAALQKVCPDEHHDNCRWEKETSCACGLKDAEHALNKKRDKTDGRF